MSDSPRVCVIVNKTAGKIGPSETFLRAHATRLPTETLALVGNPEQRRVGVDGGPFLASQALVSRAMRRTIATVTPLSRAALDRRMVRRFLERESVDVVLAEYGPTAVSVMDACREAGVPLVAHFHGWDAYVLPRRPDVLRGYRRLFSEATAIVAVSRHMVSQLVSLGAPEDKVHWNPCGAEVPEDGARPDGAPPLFVAVGRFTPKKAPHHTLTAFAQVARAFPDVRMEMLGTGPLLDDSKALADDLGIGGLVTFHGAAPHELVYATLAKARCFVQHSVEAPDGDREGTPVSVLEAMALGLPVVSTRHTGIMDIVEEGVTGSLVEEHDVDAMAEAMLLYAESPKRAREVGQAARASVRERWSMGHSMDRLWAIVQSAGKRG